MITCECGHEDDDHTPECDSVSEIVLCRYDCNVEGCACEMFIARQ